MNPIKHKLNLESLPYYYKNLEIVNCILSANITSKELEVLAAFLSLDKALTDDYMFNSLARKKVMETLSLSPGGLGNHLKSLTMKGALKKHEISNKLTVNPYLLPDPKSQGYQLLIQKNEANTSKESS